MTSGAHVGSLLFLALVLIAGVLLIYDTHQK
jgi:cbb3-type cytochrome oxidase subunit 3